MVPADATLFQTLEQMLISSAGVGCVVNEDGSLRGIVELSHLNRVIRRVRREAREHYERLEGVERDRTVDASRRRRLTSSHAPQTQDAVAREGGWFAALRGRDIGLKAAPLGILALATLLYSTTRAWTLTSNVNSQQASALDWSTKLWPQTLQHLGSPSGSTVLVILIAIPLGILLTRPPLRRYGPAIVRWPTRARLSRPTAC